MDPKLLLVENRDEFINENRNFIYKIAYKVCKRSLSWENDDELSIALIAFNKACDSYNDTKGSFFGYAMVLIKNSLIDFFRKRKNTPYLIFDSEDENLEYIDYKSSMDSYQIESENKKRAEEILSFSKDLSSYKLTFNDLVNSSPSHKDTRDSLLNLALQCSKEETIVYYIKEKKMLPIKEIMLLTQSNRKFIEKWRRYILVLILILTSDEYPYIKSYLNIKVGEQDE